MQEPFPLRQASVLRPGLERQACREEGTLPAIVEFRQTKGFVRSSFSIKDPRWQLLPYRNHNIERKSSTAFSSRLPFGCASASRPKNAFCKDPHQITAIDAYWFCA